MNPKQELQKIIDGLKAKKFREEEAKGMMTEMGASLQKDLAPLFEAMGKQMTEQMTQDFARAVQQINVSVPEIQSPQVTVPEIKLPEFPAIKIPTPQVTLNPTFNVPETKITMPDQMQVTGSVSLKGIDKKNPLPVILTDIEGKPMLFPISSGGGGGRGDFFTIQGFSQSAFSSFQNADGRLRVSVETGGSGLTDSELRATAVPVSQVSGASFSVSVAGATGTIGVVTINPDGNPVYGGTSSGGGLTDTELRASSVPVSQVSGNTDSVNVVSTVGLTDTQIRATSLPISQVSGASFSTNVLSLPAVSISDVFGSTGTNVINPDGRLKVELPTGSSGLTDTELRATAVPVSQVSGAGWTTTVSDIFGSTITTGVLNADNRIRVSLETGGSGLTDAELRASHLDVQQLSGAIDSVYVTGIFGSTMATSDMVNADNRLRVSLETGGSGLTDSELRASHLDVQQLSGATDSVNIVSSVALTVTGITNSIASALVDSSGVAYSGSNPVPVTFSAAGFQNVAMFDAQQSAITSHFDATGDFRGLDNTNIRTVNFESVLNSSATTLGISGVFTGLAEDIKDYSVITLSVFADQNSATDGLSIQQSSNGTNWDIVKTFTVTASQGKLISVQAGARYFRVVYTNGGVAQGAFRMMPIFKQGNQKGSSQRTSDASSNEEDLEQVWSFNSGYNGTTWDRVSVNNGAATTAQRVVHATDAVASTNIAAQGVTLDVRQVSGASNSVNVLAGTITTVTTVTTLTGITQSAALFKSRQTNPTAIANDWVAPAADDLGRLTTRPVQVRDLIRTAYVSVANGTETTLLAGTAGTFSDLIKIMLSNNSTAAVGVDVRAVTGGNITHHFEIPANGVVGESLSVPWPQDATGNNWTVDLPDITGTTVTVSALFTQEV